MKKRFLSIIMATVSATAMLFSGCSGENGGKIPPAPDYSASTLQFDFYGYSSAIDGWNIDGVSYSSGLDYKTVERIKEYKDVGMTIYFPQSAAPFNGNTPFEESEAKRVMDNSLEAGIDKVILWDPRIQGLSKPAKENAVGLIGEGKQFATEADLDAQIAEWMAPYKDHEAFYGVMLGDEPFYYHTENYGQVYRSIKRVCPEAYIQYNLNPITAGTTMSAEGIRNIDIRFPQLEEGDEGYGAKLDSDEELIARYKKYLRGFMDATGANYIQYDQYPLTRSDIVDAYQILGLQVVAEIAKEYDAEFYYVTQSYAQTERSPYRKITQEDLYWMNNMLVGFGIKQISYFTYFTKADNNAEHFIDGQSFITWNGERTKIYDWMKQIMAEEQKFAPTILNFDYKTSKVYMKQPTVFDSTHALRTIETADFTALKDVSINKEIALVTELYDEEKQTYMYMLQNIVDPLDKGSKSFQTTVLTFDAQYKYAAVYVKGERTLKKLDNGTLTLKHKPGEATYVMPY
ncbi:MAG: hypothetical protein IJX30_04665 [Clostridia bacterium]|nr:hypothetical protein [Clostridia bacterium]